MVVEGIVITLTPERQCSVRSQQGSRRAQMDCVEGVLWEAKGKKQLFKMAHNKSLKLTTVDSKIASSQSETVEVCRVVSFEIF